MSLRAELAPTLRLAVPVVLAELGWMGMGVVDTIMVGPLGPSAIGAAGVGTSMQMALAIFGMGVLLGLDTLVSQAYGARDVDDCHRWLLHGSVLALLMAAPMMAVCLVLLIRHPLLGFHPDVMPLLQVVLLGGALEHAVPAGLRRVPSLPAGHARGHAGHVRADVGQPDQRRPTGCSSTVTSGLPRPGRRRRRAWATLLSRIYMMVVLLVAIWWTTARQGTTPVAGAAHGRAARLRRLLMLGLPAASQVGPRSACSRWPPRWPACSIPFRALASDRAQHGGRRLHDAARPGLGGRGARRPRGGGGRSAPGGGRRVDSHPARHRVHDGIGRAVRGHPAPRYRPLHHRRGRAQRWHVAALHGRHFPVVRRHPGRDHRHAAWPRATPERP